MTAPERTLGELVQTATQDLSLLVSQEIALAFAIGRPTTLGVGFLVVGLLYLTAAGVLALTGKKKLGQVGPPEKTIETLKDDAAWAKHPTRTS